MANIENDIVSSSIPSTHDINYQHPIHHRYHSVSGHHTSNTDYNECLTQQQNNDYFDTSVSTMMSNNGRSSSSATSAGTPTSTAPLPVGQVPAPLPPPAPPVHRILRPHSTPATLIWLEDNYELAEGVCIPRSVLYLHYVDFCAHHNVQPVNAASFGKIIRQQFPQLTTRRLGTRGQSRYHYYGIAIRESSSYYQISYSKKSGQNNVDPLKREARENITKQSISTAINSRTRTATMLPQFPDIKNVTLHQSIDKDKISTFLMMYRTHCQRILDTIIRANFDEVQTFVLHFWQGVPPHLSPILECNSVINLIGVCDSILYKTIANVLLPSVLQTLPESLTKMMRQFASELDSWLRVSLYNLPESLRSVKLELARRFSQVLKRQTTLNHLSQATRMVVHNNEITIQMLRDWRLIDIQNICREILSDFFSATDGNDGTGHSAATTTGAPANGSSNSSNNGANSVNSSQIDTDTCCSSIKLITKFCQQFEHLLEEEAQIENYLEWLESLVQRCVIFPSLNSVESATVRRYSRHFLLLWSAFGSRVIRDMTLHSAQSFGSFHLLRLMFDDYVLYLVEYLQLDEQMKQFMKLIPNNEAPVFTVFYFNDCEMMCNQNVNQSADQLEYEPTVSSSTGDFGPSDGQQNHDMTGLSVDTNQTETITQTNPYSSYYNSTPNSFNSYSNQNLVYGSHVEQPVQRHHNLSSYSWYSQNISTIYEFGDQQQQANNGQPVIINDQLVSQQSSMVNEQTIEDNCINGHEYYECIQ